MKTQHLLDELAPLLGADQPLQQVNHTLKAAVQRLAPAEVGALQVTCSDVAEHETSESFQQHFCRELVPKLSHGARGPFRTANLGARYERNSVRIAEDHFATEPSRRGYKLMVLRISSHVAVGGTAQHPELGTFTRYGRPSIACGMLAAVLDGDESPAAREIRATMGSRGQDRMAQLLERPESDRRLIAAITQARLQSRRACIDLMEHRTASPTVSLVMGSTTLNRQGPDTEIPVALYLVDQRHQRRPPDIEHPGPQQRGAEGNATPAWYQGLGDQPRDYEVYVEHGRVHVRDQHLQTRRPAHPRRELLDDA